MNIIAAHLYHDSTFCLFREGQYFNLELERVYQKRNYDWRLEQTPLEELASLIRRDTSVLS